jgi:hypothetical protein
MEQHIVVKINQELAINTLSLKTIDHTVRNKFSGEETRIQVDIQKNLFTLAKLQAIRDPNRVDYVFSGRDNKYFAAKMCRIDL